MLSVVLKKLPVVGDEAERPGVFHFMKKRLKNA